MSHLLEPSALVRKFAQTIAAISKTSPVLDAACGEGRNSFVLARLGCQVVCVDRDRKRLEEISKQLTSGSSAGLSKLIRLYLLDLKLDPWPFQNAEFAAIVNVHFFLPELLQHFHTSLSRGGCLLLETPPGCGGNYRGLPKAGHVKHELLSAGFDIEYYREGRAGPAVSVKAFARKRPAS